MKRKRPDSVVWLMPFRKPPFPKGPAIGHDASLAADDTTVDIGGEFGPHGRRRAEGNLVG